MFLLFQKRQNVELRPYTSAEHPRPTKKIIHKLTQKLNYWKQFKLTQIGKARVIDIFLASKLIFATKFYVIPANIQKGIQKSIFDFINFPNKVITISQHEMWKTKTQGGIKLMNIKIKSETAKAKWLIDIVTNEHLKLNLNIFTRLIGQQKGNISGKDLLFLETSYFKKTGSTFYG